LLDWQLGKAELLSRPCPAFDDFPRRDGIGLALELVDLLFDADGLSDLRSEGLAGLP
jgi:hypothetical protein